MSFISCFTITSLISCHSTYVSISCHPSHVSISCHSSHVTHLTSHHYVTHLMSHHCVTDAKLLTLYSPVATFNFCPWRLPTIHPIILPVTSAHPLYSNIGPPRSLLLPRRIGIGFLGCLSPITVSISCHSSHVSSLRHYFHVSSLRHSSHVTSLRHWY